MPPRLTSCLYDRFKWLGLLRPVALLVANQYLKRRTRAFLVSTRAGVVIEGTTHDVIQRYIYVFGVWEPNISQWVEDFLNPGDVVLDIGGNIGYFTLLASRLVGPEGRIVVVEPLPSIAKLLIRNQNHNAAGNVQLAQVAAGDRSGMVDVYAGPATNLGSSSTVAGAGFTPEGQVPIVPASEFFRDSEWPLVRLVKIDIEGDEEAVVCGLARVLPKLAVGAALLIEVTPGRLDQRGRKSGDLFALLNSLGFRPSIIQNEYRSTEYAWWKYAPPRPMTTEPTRMTDLVFEKIR